MTRPKYTVECEDCGKFALMSNDSLSIFLIDKEFISMTTCVFCNRHISNGLSKEVAISLFWENVKIFDFNNGEQIVDQKVFDRI
jgi:hypothetical protein